MRNKYIVTESEKERILNLHEQAYPPIKNISNVVSTVPKIVSSATPEQKKLINAASSWYESNKTTLPKTVAEITKFLNDKVTAKELTPESLPYIKAAIQSNSNGELIFPVEETGGKQVKPQPATNTTQEVKMGVQNPKVTKLQELLNKAPYNSGLVPDGKLGPKTLAAIQNAVKIKLGNQTPAQTNQTSAQTNQTPAQTEQPNSGQVGTVNDKEFV